MRTVAIATLTCAARRADVTERSAVELAGALHHLGIDELGEIWR